MSPLKGSKDPEHRPIDTRQTYQGAIPVCETKKLRKLKNWFGSSGVMQEAREAGLQI